MSYLHIENLYMGSAQSILAFRECFALEKIHGTAAHISWRGQLQLHPGGEAHDTFKAMFDEYGLKVAFAAIGQPDVTVYGEAYGGDQQGQSWRYGLVPRFAAFEVQIGETWLAVPDAHRLVSKIGLEFVHYRRVSTDLAALDAERDAPSEQARRNGVAGEQPREGVVLRPPFEVQVNDGRRVIAKHKRREERETTTYREVDPAAHKVWADAASIAFEWVTPRRLEHVIAHLTVDGVEPTLRNMRAVMAAMQEDVLREGAGEIIDSKDARTAIGHATSKLFLARVRS